MIGVINMTYWFFLMNNDERQDPGKLGFNYAKTQESRWIKVDDCKEFATGAVKGIDYVYYDEKSYMVLKRYLDAANKKIVILCVESPSTCDTRTSF